MDEIPKYGTIEQFNGTAKLAEEIQKQVAFCEKLYSLPRRDLALHGALATNPQNKGELLGNAESILNWLNKDR